MSEDEAWVQLARECPRKILRSASTGEVRAWHLFAVPRQGPLCPLRQRLAGRLDADARAGRRFAGSPR